MAHMYPERGPSDAIDDKNEHAVYRALKDGLNDAYWVFHHLVWFSADQKEKTALRECDFLILHRERGILIVEVKGGRSIGTIVNVKLKQARTLKPLLHRYIWNAPLTRPYAATVNIHHAAWFVDMQRKSQSQESGGTDTRPLLDKLDLSNPEAGLLRLYKEQSASNGGLAPLGDDAIQAIVETLSSNMRDRVRLIEHTNADEQHFVQLRAFQVSILDLLGRNQRMQIEGASGTGKTILAFEKARRLAVEGKRTLLLCTNPAVARSLAQAASLEPPNVQGYLHVRYVSELCAEQARSAGILWGLEYTQDNDPDVVFGHAEKLAELLSMSLRALDQRKAEMPYDAMVIDEAEDLNAGLQTHLPKLLRDRRNGTLFIFLDRAQRVSSERWRMAIPNLPPAVSLTANIRNTRAIFDVLMHFYEGDVRPTSHGPEGQPIDYLPLAWFSNAVQTGEDEEVAALRQSLDRLIKLEGYAPENILVISCRPKQPSSINQASRWVSRVEIGTHKLAWQTERTPGHVSVATIRMAKGLERQVVVLTELDGVAHDTRRNVLLYTALGRATSHLVVHGSEEELMNPVKTDAATTRAGRAR